MKKAAFTIQVFGIIAMFPIYFAIELNQGEKTLNVNNHSTVITWKISQEKVQAELNSKAKSKNTFLDISKVGLIN